MDVAIPISIDFMLPIPFTEEYFNVNYAIDFHFNIIVIISMVGGMFLLYLLSSVTAATFGISTEGTVSLKQILTFLVKYAILNLPLLYLLSQSEVLVDYSVIVSLIVLVIYVLNFVIDVGAENSVN